jgi:hypothetical protein
MAIRIAIHSELLRCHSASGGHVLEYVPLRFSFRLAFRAAHNPTGHIPHVFAQI